MPKHKEGSTRVRRLASIHLFVGTTGGWQAIAPGEEWEGCPTTVMHVRGGPSAIGHSEEVLQFWGF